MPDSVGQAQSPIDSPIWVKPGWKMPALFQLLGDLAEPPGDVLVAVTMTLVPHQRLSGFSKVTGRPHTSRCSADALPVWFVEFISVLRSTLRGSHRVYQRRKQAPKRWGPNSSPHKGLILA